MVKASVKFIFYSFKPLSKTADAWDIKDIIQAILIILGWSGGGGWTLSISHNIAIWILAGMPAILFLIAGVKLQYRLLRARFYFKFDSYDKKLLSLPPAPFKGSTSFNLTVSNQENKPRGISRFMLEIQLENGDKKELPPMEPDCETKANITLYLQPHEPKTVWLNFVYEVKPKDGSEKLYVFDDRGAWYRVPINVDTMVTMA